jgi:O-antigen/teichoic acid export membrane protein
MKDSCVMPRTQPIDEPKRATQLGHEFAWVLSGQIAAGLGGLAGVKMLTRAMSPSAYGEFSLALTGTILAQQCVGGPLGQAAMRFYSASHEGGWTFSYLRALNRLMLKGVAVLLGVAVVTVLSCALAGHVEKAALVALALLLAILTGYNIVLDAIQSGSRNRPVVALHQAAIQWLRPAGALALLYLISSHMAAAIFGYVAGTTLVLGSQVLFLAKQVSPSVSRKTVTPKQAERQLLDYAWPFATWGLLAWGQIASDRWFLELFRDTPSVAAFTVCYQLGYYPVILLTTAVSNLASPIIFQIAGTGTESNRLEAALRANQKHIQALVAITLAAIIGFGLFHSTVFRLLTTSAYAPYSVYLPVLAASAGIFAIAQAASLVFLISSRSSELTSAKCVPAIAGLLLNMCGAYFWGVPGAVAATLLFSLIYLAAVWRLIVKAAPHPAIVSGALARWPNKQISEG